MNPSTWIFIKLSNFVFRRRKKVIWVWIGTARTGTRVLSPLNPSLSPNTGFILDTNDSRNEEVQFLENELWSQKQKFSKLKSFTRSLLIAVKNKDRKKQRELLASLPQKVNEDCDLGLENHSESGAEMPTIQKESSVSEEEEDTDQMTL
ncbi:highly divergent homeobox-like [Sinocyclocheilus grahami]|uniref:highly divergent homeobox-like n=1 Tax=Sinocyclocheilus grahami TaxID=75366 RepID=UPI0007AC5B3F|nr:PREDICTED: highly divergent homeobox-like [Sinocyclocheilus grahami]